MSEKLKIIDQGLIELEDQLLRELRRLRQQGSTEICSQIDPKPHGELKLIYSNLLKSLQATGGWSNLSLKSEEQEWIEHRMRVVRNLLIRKLPTAFLTAGHEEHKATSSSKFGTDAHYASEALTILDEQVTSHQVNGRTIEEVIQERAEFNSKELSKGYSQDHKREIAQSPDEIRNKLKGLIGSGGPSTFAPKDLAGSTPRTAVPKRPSAAAKKNTIAQSPAEIRRTLAEQQASHTDKASFGSKDVAGVADKMPPPLVPPPKGKAVFASRDIEPIPDKSPAESEKEKAPPKPKSGRAVFESKDLS
jgi:hypothetical protein